MAMNYGRVVGGHYLNATVQPAMVGSDLVVQAGLKWRKLNEEQVAQWEEVPADENRTVSVVSQAVAEAVLPRFISKTASAAVGATIDSTMRPPRTIRIRWVDGKTSLVKLPHKLFTHLALVLEDREAKPVEQVPETAEAAPTPGAPSMTEQAFTHLSGLLKGGRFSQVERAPESSTPVPTGQPEVTEQLMKLAGLRDAGILTEDEFAMKKAELLNRI